MFLSLFVDFVNTRVPKNLLLPLQIVSLAGEQLVSDAHLTLVVKWPVIDVHVEIKAGHAFASISFC